MSFRCIAALLVSGALAPTAALADVMPNISPSSFYTGSAEEFVRIMGTGLAGSDMTLMTTVVFDGPAGSFSIDASTESDMLLEVFVPVQVFTVAGTYTLTVFAHDTGGVTRQIGP